jgi:type IV secretory pathway VirB2 component (pilin)
MTNLAIWDTLKGFFLGLYDKFNDFLANTLDIDGKLIDLYQEFIVPLPEIIKIVGIVFTGIIIVLGVLSFVKKMLKLFVVLAVILAIVLILTRL